MLCDQFSLCCGRQLSYLSTPWVDCTIGLRESGRDLIFYYASNKKSNYDIPLQKRGYQFVSLSLHHHSTTRERLTIESDSIFLCVLCTCRLRGDIKIPANLSHKFTEPYKEISYPVRDLLQTLHKIDWALCLYITY